MCWRSSLECSLLHPLIFSNPINASKLSHSLTFIMKLIPVPIFFFFCRANILFIYLFFSFISTSWRPTTLQYCSGSCHTLTRISHGKAPISKGQSPNLWARCRRFFMIWSMQHSYLCLTKPSLSPENQKIFLLSAYLDLFPASFFSVVIRTEVL